ncbi:glycine betaine ABC transporter substrate-binding protein [Kineosporia succinea]|uniref:Glycine betaine/proline transport system substrate-binding protein n=1 Tax=Kineosporia succinea TaxID=84632 RepID=A0ABT9P7I0_9ACTN|nr:glycine betaine ABC transporter substrate-binding protein [Kineosporia succinea]MDP9828657.1 glycine betaine/proline transport system substrate-binding protein [Kineosporia succinea]
MTTRSRLIALTAGAGLALTVLTGCGGPAPAVVAAPGVQPKDCGTVTLAENPWVGYSANLAVISYLARTELGCEVKVVSEAEDASWQHLADGSVDAILENWGHDDLKKKYIDNEKVAVEAGLTGNKGVIGWFVPPWMAEEYPDITNWQNLNQYADLFDGTFLDGDPTYVTNDKALIENLGLDLTVAYTGSEEKLIAAFEKAQEKRKPMIGYFYSPQWLLSEIDLVHIKLPAYTPGCDADPDTVRCDYQSYDLDKIQNRDFAYSGSPAAELIQRFRWGNDDQNQVARDLNAGLAPDDAARKWLDANQATWRSWLPGAVSAS